VASSADAAFMRRALELARRAEGRTSPNPMVGAVVVAPGDDQVVGEGFHRRAGEPHAEIEALAAAGERARGATLYVSLEPCAHRGGGRRTEPCAPRVVASGVARMVYGLADPFPGHGGGAEEVAGGGVKVEGPLLADECARVNEAWIVFARRRRAHVTLKAAMTLDGRIATAGGESRWITGAAARADVHRRRDRVDAVLVGAGTVLADDPLLTVRGVEGGRDPLRVILDGALRTPTSARVAGPGTVIATTEQAPAEPEAALRATGAEVWRLPGAAGRVDLGALVEGLARRDLVSLLVEGGAGTHAAFLAAGLCDRLLLYLAPMAFGGAGAPAWLGGGGAPSLAAAPRFRFDGEPRRLGEDLLLEAVPLL
jgi:diaminohydroxyphosphoribosylaminopyrimidine deaminase/5-amino-6-(5-phosphoribosylamino)uracil reductase